MTLYLAFLFHIYQPPTQTPYILKKISRESYMPLIRTLMENEKAKITLNINGSLTELLEVYQENEVIEGIKTLVREKRLELTATSCYHAILPLIPQEELIRQIDLNEEIQKKCFDQLFTPRGFWLPEMAFDGRVVEPIAEKGFKWTVISSVGSPEGELPQDYIPWINNHFITYFRNDLLSNLISFKNPTVEEFFKELIKQKNPKDEDTYTILAMDGETYGHHISGLIENFLIPLFDMIKNDNQISMITISEIETLFQKKKNISPVACSWSTTNEDLKKGVPFPLWDDPENKIHKLQHKIINHVIFLVSLARKYQSINNCVVRYMNARDWLDKGLHSCQLWWASKKPWYSAEMILKGLNQLILAASEALKVILVNSESDDEKKNVERIFDEIFEAQKELYLIA